MTPSYSNEKSIVSKGMLLRYKNLRLVQKKKPAFLTSILNKLFHEYRELTLPRKWLPMVPQTHGLLTCYPQCYSHGVCDFN